MSQKKPKHGPKQFRGGQTDRNKLIEDSTAPAWTPAFHEPPWFPDLGVCSATDALEIVLHAMEGLTQSATAALESLDIEEFLRTFDINTFSLYLNIDGCQLVAGDRAEAKNKMEIFEGITKEQEVAIYDWLQEFSSWPGVAEILDKEIMVRCLRYWRMRASDKRPS